MSPSVARWDKVMIGAQSETLLFTALQNAASGLAKMMGRPVSIDTPRAELVPISQIGARVGGPDAEMVGIYLLMIDELPGQAILMMSLNEALRLVDLITGAAPGTSVTLGDIERSALAEAGNVTVSFFLNALGALAGTAARPSPPAVIVDMLGAILDVIASSAAAVSDNLLIVETTFNYPEGALQAHFWVLPELTIES
jgi:chemotaxis protein CheC